MSETIPLSSDDPTGFPTNDEWTSSNTLAADHEGWNLFECDGSGNGSTQLCRDDEMEVFPNDDAAWKHVIDRAREGSELHIKAMRLVEKYNPIEHKAFKAAFGWI